MPMTLNAIFHDSETHHRLSLFDLVDLKDIKDTLFEKKGKPYLTAIENSESVGLRILNPPMA